MVDLTKTIEAKSDQMNASDLAIPVTIKVAKVSLLAEEQPVAISYIGDNGKPYKPCKSMRRVLVKCWGGDGAAYVGRSMTLWCDDSVIFGGQAVGGIRISHLSHIPAELTMSLTATKKSKKPYTVKPLIVESAKPETPKLSADDIAELKEIGYEKAREGIEILDAWKKSLNGEQKSALGKEYGAELTKIASDGWGL